MTKLLFCNFPLITSGQLNKANSRNTISNSIAKNELIPTDLELRLLDIAPQPGRKLTGGLHHQVLGLIQQTEAEAVGTAGVQAQRLELLVIQDI